MRNVGDRVLHKWQLTGQTVFGTVQEQTTKEGETAWRIVYDTPQQLPMSEQADTEIIVKQTDIDAWPVVV